MNRTRAGAFGIFLGILAATDWFVPVGTADQEGEKPPSVQVSGVEVTAKVVEVETEAGKETHAVLVLAGDGAGSLKVRLQEMPFSPMSRMMPTPKTLWSRDVAFDTKTGREIDLGVVPAAVDNKVHSIAVASELPEEFQMVLVSWQKPLPQIEVSPEEIKETVAKNGQRQVTK